MRLKGIHNKSVPQRIDLRQIPCMKFDPVWRGPRTAIPLGILSNCFCNTFCSVRSIMIKLRPLRRSKSIKTTHSVGLSTVRTISGDGNKPESPPVFKPQWPESLRHRLGAEGMISAGIVTRKVSWSTFVRTGSIRPQQRHDACQAQSCRAVRISCTVIALPCHAPVVPRPRPFPPPASRTGTRERPRPAAESPPSQAAGRTRVAPQCCRRF